MSDIIFTLAMNGLVWGLFVTFPSREVCAISTGMEQDLILPNIGMSH